MHGQVSGGIGAKADEGRLPERGQSADARQQHEAQRHQSGEPDIVHQRDLVVGQYQWREADRQHEQAEREEAPDHSSSSSVISALRLRSSRIGMMRAKTIASLNALAQK